MVLSVFRFRHTLRKILTGNTLCHITGMRKWNLYMLPKGSLVLRTQNRTRLLQEGHIYFINPGTLHGLFGNSPFSHHYALVFRLDMLNFLQTDSCQTSYLVPLCSGKYLFPDSEALAPELTAQIAALIKKQPTSTETAIPR